MDRFQKEIMVKEIENFKQISREYNYRNINELIGHYIEESIINSEKELIKILCLVKNKLRININITNFKDCWSN
ncbi:MAG: hypothetical protein NTW64_05105 [Candidatus Omnitrophica bacterium]|nr:hypothetical protein [Candidatus Omnitrophota bacterium]